MTTYTNNHGVMNPSTTAPTGKAARRFYHARLRGVYTQCPLPTKTDSSLFGTVVSSSYAKSVEENSGFRNTTHTPPNQSIGLSSLSVPFAASAAATKKPASKKKAKSAESAAVPTPIEPLDTDAKRKKKPKPFTRKAPLEGNLRTYKIKMIPTPAQVVELKRTFSAARFAYNWALGEVKAGNVEPTSTAPRDHFRKNATMPAWASGKQPVASRILAGACKQVSDAYASNFAKTKKNPSHSFDINFRSTSEVIKIDKDNGLKKQSTLSRFQAVQRPYPKGDRGIYRHNRAECLAFLGNNLKGVGGILLQDKPHVIEKLLAEGNRLKEDAKIILDKRTQHYHFVWTFEQPKLPDPDPAFQTKRIAANDPGVRGFQTWYSPTTGAYGELLEGFQQQIEGRLQKLDRLTSRVAKRYERRAAARNGKVCNALKAPPDDCSRTRRQRYRTTRALARKLSRDRQRHVGWVQSAHYFAANSQLRENDLIIQPWLHCAALVPKSSRVLGCKTVRNMLTMSHFKYRERLQWAATRYAGRHVLVTEEPGTSKTCTNCGHWKADLGAAKTYKCTNCSIEVDRDVAGARNNFFAAYGDAVGIGWDGVSD